MSDDKNDGYIDIEEARRRRKETGKANADARGDSWKQLCIKRGDTIDGKNAYNAMVALRHAPEWQGVLAYNRFTLRVVIKPEIPAAGEPIVRPLPRNLEDCDVTAALQWFH